MKDDEAAEEQTEPKKKWVSKGNKPAEEEVPASNPKEKKARKRQEQSLDQITVGEEQITAGNKITAREDQTSAGDQITAVEDQFTTGNQITARKDQTSAEDRGARAQMLEARAQLLEEKWREFEILETQAAMRRYSLLQEECALHLESLKAPRGHS